MSYEMILMLGMHRSGTSCLAGSLQARGLFLGEVFTANPYNKKGNRENADVMALNADILQYSGGDWDSIPGTISWTKEQQRKRDSILKSLKQYQITPWGIKDPRFCFTLPFWLEAIKKPQLIASFRHPSLVGLSLSKRNKFDHKDSVLLWTQYNEKLLNYLDNSPFPLICFDVNQEQYLQDIDRLCCKLSLNENSLNNRFFNSGLRNLHVDEDLTLPSRTTEIYNELRTRYRHQVNEGYNLLCD